MFETTFQANYLMGVPEFKKSGNSKIKIKSDGFELKLSGKVKFISWSELKTISVESTGSITQQKSFSGGKSLAGAVGLGIISGGVLALPGLVLGANGHTQTNDTRKVLVYIEYINAYNEIGTILLSALNAYDIVNAIENKKLENHVKNKELDSPDLNKEKGKKWNFRMIFGVFFAIGSLSAFGNNSYILGIIELALSLFLIPQTNKLIFDKIKEFKK
jgi:hypothetical protein